VVRALSVLRHRARGAVLLLLCAAGAAACNTTPTSQPNPPVTVFASVVPVVTVFPTRDPNAPVLAPNVTIIPTQGVIILPTLTPIPTNTSTPTSTPTPTPTPTPTATISPYAARVNNEFNITKAVVESELRRLQGPPATPAPASTVAPRVEVLRKRALEIIIDDVLMVDYAARNGLQITREDLDAEIARAEKLRGGPQAYDTWLKEIGLTRNDALELARRALTARLIRDRVLSTVPATAEHWQLAHILFANEADAAGTITQLNAGADFAVLARARSRDDGTRDSGGQLGWVLPGAGNLVWPELETAAAALRTGQISGPVKSPVGVHVIKLIDRQTRPLRAQDAAVLRERLLRDFVEKLRASASIEYYP
jgi:parvulin-like peptidyl-prolyl isomerase